MLLSLFVWGDFMRRESLVSNEEKLLFDILQELKKLNNQPKEGKSFFEKSKYIPEKKKEIVEEEKFVKMYPCKYCGGQHEKPIQIALCAKALKEKERNGES